MLSIEFICYWASNNVSLLNMEIYRGLVQKLVERAKTEAVVIVEGARATGKTTLAEYLVDSGIYKKYVSLSDETTYQAAKASPKDFIQQLEFGTIIDEAQLVEDITVPIKSVIDKNSKPGRFLLTGSTRLLRTNLGGSDPLAGRTLPPLPLYPLTIREREGEILKTTANKFNSVSVQNIGSFIDVLWDESASLSSSTDLDLEILKKYMTSGSMPGFLSINNDEIRELRYEQYLRGSINLPTFSGRDLTLLESFYRYLAGSTATIVNFEKFSRTNGIQGSTAKAYLSLFIEAMLIVSLPGWRLRQTKVELQSPKLHVFDLGVATSLGGLNPHASSEEFGQLLETLVITDLLSQASWSNNKVDFFHWRYKQNHEIDLLLVNNKNQKKQIICVEIKSNSTVTNNDFLHIRKFRELYPNDFFKGIVFYTGKDLFPFGEDLWAVPVGCLLQ